MKVVRIVFILLAIAAVISLVAYLFTKKTVNSSTLAINPSVTSPSQEQNPAEAGVVFSNTTPSREVVIEASEYKFVPSEIRIKKGETVKITLKNSGKMSHDWFVDGLGGASIDLTSAGVQNSIVITASQKGTFTTYCSVGNHRKMGMVGKLVVE